MRLIRYGEKGKELPGIELDGQRYDCSQYFKSWDREFFESGGLEKLKSVIRDNSDDLIKVSTEARWGSPIDRPGMILCIGLNYSDHAAEAGMATPTEPIIFMKATNTIGGPYDNVPLPKNSTKTDWEVELGVVIGKTVTYLDNTKQAEEAIAGYCVINDYSERAFQLEMGGQWVKGKSCPGFTPVGPYLVTKEDVSNVNDLWMKLSVNGQEVQNGNTKTMVFDPFFVVHYISQFMTLEAGDIISTGTPPGVGMGMNPPTYLGKGDVVELSIEHLGRQQQTII